MSPDAGFETLGVEEPYRGRSTVRIETVRTPEGDAVEREIVAHDDAVAVVPVTEAGEVVLVRQYRHAARRYLLEIPAGTMDHDGEEPEGTARRELAEETGYDAEHLEHLVTFDNSPGWSEERTHVYLARGLVAVGTPDDYEPEHEEADMDVVRLDLGEAIAAARRGELSDAKTLIGLLLVDGR